VEFSSFWFMPALSPPKPALLWVFIMVLLPPAPGWRCCIMARFESIATGWNPRFACVVHYPEGTCMACCLSALSMAWGFSPAIDWFTFTEAKLPTSCEELGCWPRLIWLWLNMLNFCTEAP